MFKESIKIYNSKTVFADKFILKKAVSSGLPTYVEVLLLLPKQIPHPRNIIFGYSYSTFSNPIVTLNQWDLKILTVSMLSHLFTFVVRVNFEQM